MIHLGTCLTRNYTRRAMPYLASLRHAPNPFCVCYGFQAGGWMRREYPHVRFLTRAYPAPADCHGCIQYGAWMEALEEASDEDLYVLTDADGVLQRPLGPSEVNLLEGIQDGFGVAWNAGEGDTLGRELPRLGRGGTIPPEAGVATIYPGYASVPCYNGGFLAARPPAWRAMTARYEAAWPTFNALFTHRSRCQWLLCWLLREFPVTVLPWSLHAHGHFAWPAGIARDTQGVVRYHGQEVFFVHRFL